jgi:hypothetical protein
LNVLRGWLNSTWSAREILRGWDLRRIQAREQANHRAILVLMASELYRREKGSETDESRPRKPGRPDRPTG